MRHFVGAIKRSAGSLLQRIGVKVEIRRRRHGKPPGEHRFDYQKRHIEFGILPGMRTLDIGSGGDPFPGASVLVERFLEPVYRTEKLVTADKPLVLADIHYLPFPRKSFDFVFSSHVLEVIDDPIQASQEIMRVGKRGYIETPTFGKDMLFAWARTKQKWHVTAIGPHLCFFEYSDRQLDGINSHVWRNLIFDKWQHPLQQIFWDNQDVFNVMFLWDNEFSVFVFYLDGSIRTLNTSVPHLQESSPVRQ
jgi:hypothetical protein